MVQGDNCGCSQTTSVGCTVVSVNCAYTSQLDSRFATLTGSRNGEKFTGHDGVVMSQLCNFYNLYIF